MDSSVPHDLAKVPLPGRPIARKIKRAAIDLDKALLEIMVCGAGQRAVVMLRIKLYPLLLKRPPVSLAVKRFGIKEGAIHVEDDCWR